MTKGTKTFMYAFFAFAVTLFTFVAIISAPVVSRDIGTGGVSMTTKYHQTLKAEDYVINQYLSSVHLRNSFFHGLFSARQGNYYSVTVVAGPNSGSEMMVRVVGDKLESLENGDTVDLYGQVSQGHKTYGTFTEDIPCLNDNGDTVLFLWFQTFFFAACDAFVIWIWRKIQKKLSGK